MNKQKNLGFTIVELIIVFIIIEVLSIVVSSSLKILEIRELKNTALVIQSDIRYSQTMSNIENIDYIINFDIENMSYKIQKDKDKYIKTVKNVYFNNTIIEYLTTCKDNKLKFTPKLTTSTPCTVTLITKNYYLTLTINLGCGRVNIDKIKNKNCKFLLK